MLHLNLDFNSSSLCIVLVLHIVLLSQYLGFFGIEKICGRAEVTHRYWIVNAYAFGHLTRLNYAPRRDGGAYELSPKPLVSPILVPSSPLMAEFEVGSSTRPSTPPPRPGPSNLDLTPEQVKRIEINRLKGAPVIRQGVKHAQYLGNSEGEAEGT